MIKKIIKISQIPLDVDMSRYLSNEFFKDYLFEINNPKCIECDFWFIFNNLPLKLEQAIVSPQNIFLITGEFDGGYNQSFLRQFSKVFTIDQRLKGSNIIYYHLGLPWFINQSFDQLFYQKEIKKTKLLSVVSSDKSDINYTRNYKIRYEFVLALKTYFGDDIDVFGRGFHEFEHKDDVLMPYKFTVALENICLPYNITEKLYDSFLTHTFPFYYDCNNLNRFIDDDAYIKLDITDHRYSIDLIKKVINTSQFYEDRLDVIIKAKEKYLLEYSYIANMVQIIHEFGLENGIKQSVTISRDNELKSKVKLMLINSIFNKLS